MRIFLAARGGAMLGPVVWTVTAASVRLRVICCTATAPAPPSRRKTINRTAAVLILLMVMVIRAPFARIAAVEVPATFPQELANETGGTGTAFAGVDRAAPPAPAPAPRSTPQ